MYQEGLALDVGPKAYRCYRELINFIDHFGYVPSYKELSERLGCAPSTVGRYLRKLEAEGVVQRAGRRARSLIVKVTE